jgi:flavin-dependent dehydrogenase
LMTALLLARAGIRCVVLDRKSGISTHPKAMGISRRTSELYRQLGLFDAIRKGSLGTTPKKLPRPMPIGVRVDHWSRTAIERCAYTSRLKSEIREHIP